MFPAFLFMCLPRVDQSSPLGLMKRRDQPVGFRMYLISLGQSSIWTWNRLMTKSMSQASIAAE